MNKTIALSFCFVLFLFSASAQTIITYAGGGIGNGRNPLAAYISPTRIIAHKGSIYIAETDASRIRKIDAYGTVSTIAGNGKVASRPLVTGGPATATALMYPIGLAFDSHDNLFISDAGANAIFKIDEQGIFTRVAGIDTFFTYGGDGGPATAAYFMSPVSIAIDQYDNIFVADADRIRKISGGMIDRVAGGGGLPTIGPVPATAANLKSISNISIDPSGNIFIAATDGLLKFSTAGMVGKLASSDSSTNDYITSCNADEYGNVYYYFRNTILKLDVNNTISIDRPATVENVVSMAYNAGRVLVATNPMTPNEIGAIYNIDPAGAATRYAGTDDYACDGVTGDNANIGNPLAIANDRTGNLFIAEYRSANHPFRIRQVNKDGIISTLNNYSVRISDMCTDKNNNLYLMCAIGFVYKIVPGGDTVLYAGTHSGGSTQDNIPATDAKLGTCRSITVDNAGNLYIYGGNYIRKVDKRGVISTIAGNGIYYADPSDNGVPATATSLGAADITTDNDNNIYLLEAHHIRKITADGIIHIVAGCDNCTTAADGVPALDAAISTFGANDITVDTAGNIYFSDKFDIRKIDASGIITKVAGIDTSGFSGDGGDADTAAFNLPQAISIDDSGRLYVADYTNQRIRRINTMYRFPPPPPPYVDSSGTVKIFPNPASSYLDVKWYTASQDNTTWIIFDAIGRTVLKGVAQPINGIVNEHIALPQLLPAGMYMFRRGGDRAIRFVVTR